MSKVKNKLINKNRRKAKIRATLKGTAQRPRLSIYRSNTNIYLQIIDDEAGVTLESASLKEVKDKKTEEKNSKEIELGKLIASKAINKNIETIVFDRGGYRYHGRVAAVATGARLGGLKF